MNCEEAAKLMDGYLDGELDPLPARQSNSTYETAISVRKDSKRTRLWPRQSHKALRITRPLLTCVSGFNHPWRSSRRES